MIISILLYVDPGTGSYLVQAIIAAIFGAWFWLRGYWWKIKTYFKKARPGEKEEEVTPPDTNSNV